MKPSAMKEIKIPETYNYIGVFLTFACNLRCSFCINHFEQKLIERKTMTGEEWVEGLNRIVSRDDLPVTLQGGEPSLHPDFYEIINNIRPELNIDILTNLQFDVDEFMRRVKPGRVEREAPYASIRVSFHPETMSLDETVEKTMRLLEADYSVGIWAVKHPRWEEVIKHARQRCLELGIDFRFKDFLGEYQGKLYGSYRFAGACDKKFKKNVQCRTTEFLIDSSGHIFRCHADLYEGVNAIGHILDSDFQIEDKFRDCSSFGHCNPCDMKVKTNRFQQYGHTSVEVRFNQES